MPEHWGESSGYLQEGYRTTDLMIDEVAFLPQRNLEIGVATRQLAELGRDAMERFGGTAAVGLPRYVTTARPIDWDREYIREFTEFLQRTEGEE